MDRHSLDETRTTRTGIYPPRDSMASIFARPDIYNCLQYVQQPGDRDLTNSLSRAVGYCGPYLRAVHLDTKTWPDPEVIREALANKGLQVILKITSRALHDVGNSPARLIDRINLYEDLVHRILFDKSGGQGINMNAEVVRPFIRAVRSHCLPHIQVTVSGGIGPDTLDLAESLFGEFPTLSLDAEARVHRNQKADQPLDMSACTRYLERAFPLYTHVKTA